MKRKMHAGATSQTLEILVLDKTKTDGSGLTGLTNASSGLTWYYHRQGANASVQVTLAAETLGTWTSGGFVAVDGTNMPGVYELGVPDAALASGAKYVTMVLRGATNMADVRIEIELDAVDYQDSTKFGLSNLDAASSAIKSQTDKLVFPDVTGTVNDTGPTTTGFKGNNGLSSADSFYNNAYLAFTGGTLAGIARKVTGYTGATRLFAFGTAFPTAPANSDPFVILGGTT